MIAGILFGFILGYVIGHYEEERHNDSKNRKV